MKEKFELICARLAEVDAEEARSMDFEALCGEYGADVRVMNNMFYEAFGMSGEEVICAVSEESGCKNLSGMLLL